MDSEKKEIIRGILRTLQKDLDSESELDCRLILSRLATRLVALESALLSVLRELSE